MFSYLIRFQNLHRQCDDASHRRSGSDLVAEVDTGSGHSSQNQDGEKDLRSDTSYAHRATSSCAVPRLVTTQKSRFEKVPVVVILRYRSTAPLTVTRSEVGAAAAATAVKDKTVAKASLDPLSDDC